MIMIIIVADGPARDASYKPSNVQVLPAPSDPGGDVARLIGRVLQPVSAAPIQLSHLAFDRGHDRLPDDFSNLGVLHMVRQRRSDGDQSHSSCAKLLRC